MPQPQAEQRATAPMMSRAAETRPSTYSEEDNSVEVVVSTGAAVTRFDWWDGEYYDETLSLDDGAVRMERLNGGAPLLDSHSSYRLASIVGSIVPDSARIEGGQMIARVRMASTPDVADIVAKVREGHIRNVSVGYLVHAYEVREPGEGKRKEMRATDWEPLEVSLVAIPADAGAQLRARSAEQGGNPCIIRGLSAAHSTENEMADTPVAPVADTAPVITPPAAEQRAAPKVTSKRIRELCARTEDLGSEFALELIELNDETPMAEADLLGAVSERLLEKRAAPKLDTRVGSAGTESEGYRSAIEGAIIARSNPKAKDIPESSREFRGMTLMEMARDYCARSGVSTAGLGRLEIAGVAMGMRGGALTTSDFANAMANAANKKLRRVFEAASQTFRPFVSMTTLPDFKPATIVGMGDGPALLLVRENGEFKRGALTDTGDTYQLATYGRIIPITRQVIVNDDLSVFDRVPTLFARKAADLESDAVWGQIIGNPVMYDTVTLFHASHGNLAGSGTAITIASLGAARQAFRQQKSAEGAFINVQPRYLIVGPAKEVEAQQILAAVTANTTSAINPFSGSLQLIVEPRITDNAWFLAADPADYDTIVLAHLAGQEELYTETRVGFEVDGIEMKARLDTVAKALDWRGFYKNPGA